MLSAFGIDHGDVSKSYIEGAGYGRAVDLSAKGRNLLRARVSQPAESVFKHPPYEGDTKAANSLWRRSKMPSRSQGNKVQVKEHRWIPHRLREDFGSDAKYLTGESSKNGLGGGRIDIYPAGRKDGGATLRHEVAHLTPKRNPWRHIERMGDDVRNGREEGRADFIAHGKRTPGAYPGSRKFIRGYTEVQRKMADAQKRKLS